MNNKKHLFFLSYFFILRAFLFLESLVFIHIKKLCLNIQLIRWLNILIKIFDDHHT